jgi:hypothetical protein
MPETYNGFELNTALDAAPWGNRENAAFKAIIDTVVTNTNEGAKSSSGHTHSLLKSPNGIAAVTCSSNTGGDGSPGATVNITGSLTLEHEPVATCGYVDAKNTVANTTGGVTIQCTAAGTVGAPDEAGVWGILRVSNGIVVGSNESPGDISFAGMLRYVEQESGGSLQVCLKNSSNGYDWQNLAVCLPE